MKQKSVCISPIDWGLGHATRCIQLIRALEKLGFKIYIASEGHHEAVLKEAIPTATFLQLRGYRVRYTKKRAFLIPALL
jgi:spore coat polysaccharide biosynthesis predicted glycosyltransferase SpsG